ncbi:MAG TPA: ATP-binding protein [Coleofasciculaceae cyanobacterium]|jgi:two-component system sensor histidine kinase/response regulator
MAILGNPRFSRTLPLRVFKRLQDLLQQMKLTLGEGVVVLTEEVLSSTTITPEHQAQRFTVVVSEQFRALLLGEPQESESLVEDDAKPVLYQVGLTFEPEAIASFVGQLAQQLENHPIALKLSIAQASLQPNDAAIQSEFTLSLVEILSSNGTSDPSSSDQTYPPTAVCQPFVEQALRQQVEQERLLHQVTTHIRQSLELPVILKTTVEEVRPFLQVDRLLIYQFDEFNAASATRQQDTPIAGDKTKSSNSRSLSRSSFWDSTVRWGCVTYEARSSKAISSVLNLMEKDDCSLHVANCREKYYQGHTLVVDDVEITYINSFCLLELLRQTQVRAKLVVPIVVQNNLWGLLIAHQCFEPRYWKDSEKTFLSLIAEHLSVAIYQAQLYAQLQQQKNTLEQRVIERTQALRDTLQAAETANRAKDEFLAAMSHELRTPLTCVIGMSATLLRWSYGQEAPQAVPLVKQRRYLKTIQESGEHLLELINDILDFSLVEAGKAVLNISEFSLSKLTHQAWRTLQEKALQQKVTLEMDFQVASHGDRFCADQRRVRQILFNLVGNAIKFTPEGGQVTLRVWREHNLAVFQIEDTGIGIAKEQLPLLFQKFQQLETPYHRNYEGTGLGLALTKQLVELHGGRIEVESKIGEGSCFTVWLPTQPKVSTVTAKGTPTQKRFPKPQGSIVLVEDQEESATPICEILTAAGYQVVWLIDGSTAVEQIQLLQPKAVIVDWQLSGMDGYEISYCLRNSPTTQQIKVLALTTSTLTDLQEDELSEKVDDYVSKPVEAAQLLDKVMALMEH